MPPPPMRKSIESDMNNCRDRVGPDGNNPIGAMGMAKHIKEIICLLYTSDAADDMHV